MVSKTRTPIGAITSSCAVSCRERPAQATHDYEHGRDFIADLDKFLGQLPQGWPVSIELKPRVSKINECVKQLAETLPEGEVPKLPGAG